MKKLIILIVTILSVSQIINAQDLQNKTKYDISEDRLLYTIGYSHLDTEWNWDYPTTINEYILNTMVENFRLFEKYPDYVFNFTGSRRYKMMKEYYPDLYKDVKKYVKQGRWFVSGSSVDEGEVNISSSESLIRQILYGNDFFRNEFGKESVDYMLPDCFGFLCNLPSIFNYCGLLGFSTQKLTWHSAAGIPFNVGVWNGPDGKGIIAALNATSYNGRVENRLDKDNKWNNRINEDYKRTGYAFDYRYYGVGDRGGAPRESDVRKAEESLNNKDEKFKVILSSSDQMFKDITPEIRNKLPTYSGDLLLIEHSAGSMTSHAFMKRMNRKNELLAQSAEQVAVMADWLGGAIYPKYKLNNAWDLVLGSQFHDILPGTSIPKAYEYAWNDEFIAANGFSSVLKNGLGAVSYKMNTQTQGTSLLVYNPVAKDREDVVEAELEYTTLPISIAVFDQKGKELPTQIIGRKGNKLKFLFIANVPSCGVSVYDVREVIPTNKPSSLSITSNSLENEYYKVKIASNGDILSIYDKKVKKELLSKPARLEFHQEWPKEWPAWNMDWADRQKPPIDFMNKDAILSIEEHGNVRVTLKIQRKGANSEITQLVSLSSGDAGRRLEVVNKINWQSREVSLKASFPLTASNENATYNLGVGTILRGNNNAKKFEVPSKEWFDLTDKSGKYGVSILEDCKYGSDKPDDNTLRLTLLYTPKANAFGGAFIYQSTQDWGIHDVKYAVYGHKGDWINAKTQWQAKFLNQPLLAFEAPKHQGEIGKSLSMLSINNPQVGLMAFKKKEDGDYYIIRFNELSGKDLTHVKVTLPSPILDAYEVNGQEKKIGDAKIINNKIIFNLGHHTIRSFAVKLQSEYTYDTMLQKAVKLPYNVDVISYDYNRSDGNMFNNQSLPAEMLSDNVESEGVRFFIGDKADEEKNAVKCEGQTINLPEGNYSKLYLLAAASDDITAEFKVGKQISNLSIQKWTGYVGQFYKRILTRDQNHVEGIESPFTKTDNIAWFASHCHNAYPMKNEAYQYCYLYKYEINIPTGAKAIILPNERKIKVLGITVARPKVDDLKLLQPLYDNFKNNPKLKLRKQDNK